MIKMENNRMDIFAKENKQITMEFYYNGELRQTHELDLNTEKGKTEYRFLYSDLVNRGARVANLYQVKNDIKTLVKKTEFPERSQTGTAGLIKK